MKSARGTKKQLGFTLIEIMVALGIIGAGVGVVLFYQSRAQAAAQSKDTITALTNMTTKIKTFYAPSGTYNALDAASVNSMSLVTQPITWDGANIRDAWGNAMTIAGNAVGAAPTFVVTLGGATAPLDKEVCTSLATGLGNGADVVQIAASGTLTTANGVLGAGSVYKAAGGGLNMGNLTTGCTATNPVIGLQFH